MIKHKIPLILTAVFSSILLLSVIVLSILQSSTKPNLPNPDSIKVYKNSTTASATYKKGSTEYNDIMELYTKMFEKTFLKQLADNDILERKIRENTSAGVWSDANTETGVYIELIFDTPKKYIVYRNENTRRVDIANIIFQVTKEDNFKPINIYYEGKADSSSSNNNSKKEEKEINYPLLAQANTADLYNYVITKKS